jgi:hypothetical protein
MTKQSSKRIGPVMTDITRYVAAHPGCPKLHPARACGPNGSTKYGYAAVNRALSAGLIEHRGGMGASYQLYVTDKGAAL